MSRLFDRLRYTGLRKEEAQHLSGIHQITRAPLPVASQLLMISIFILFVLAMVWSVVSRIDIVSSAQGKSVPSSRIQLIQSPQLALVEKIYVGEGDQVKAGQLLVSLDHKRLASELRDARVRAANLQAKRDRLHALIEAALTLQLPHYATPVETLIQQREAQIMRDHWAMFSAEMGSLQKREESQRVALQRIEAEQEHTRALIGFSENKVERFSASFEKGGVARAELDSARETLAERNSRLTTLDYQYAEAVTELSRAEHEVNARRERFASEQSLQLTETEQELALAQEEMLRVRDSIKQFTLESPVNGTVKDVAIATLGGVVQPAEVLMQIVPDGVPLEVEAKVLNRDIGFVFEGQQVNVKVDTFNFTKYGVIPGVIKHLADDATEDQHLGPVYRALIELERDTIHVGQRVAKLVPGMTMTVDIHVGQRRLIDYVLDPVLRYRGEVLRER